MTPPGQVAKSTIPPPYVVAGTDVAGMMLPDLACQVHHPARSEDRHCHQVEALRWRPTFITWPLAPMPGIEVRSRILLYRRDVSTHLRHRSAPGVLIGEVG